MQAQHRRATDAHSVARTRAAAASTSSASGHRPSSPSPVAPAQKIAIRAIAATGRIGYRYPAGADRWRLVTDPTLLMRFSAATANPHRIHYDWPYATRVEGYPGLVVHGPLMTMALAQTHRLLDDGTRIAALRHRNLKPLFCGNPAQLVYTRSDDGAHVELVGPDAVSSDGAAHTTLDLTLTS